MAKVAFLGLGVMGAPMAGHLAADGNDVTVYNRTLAKAQDWVEQHGGLAALTPAGAAADAEVVFMCLGNDDDVRQVVLGDDGAFSSMTSGATLVDHTTASADLARSLELSGSEIGIGFVDAPVSGGEAGAQRGQLTVMCGGTAAAFSIAEPIMAAYGRRIAHIGPAGHGQLAKMVNQLCIAGLVQGLAEGLNFGSRAGLDMAAVVDVIAAGAAQSWQLENRATTMLADQYDFGFAVEWMRKDLGICLDEARRIGARVPVAALVDQLYAQIENRGGRRWDTSSLMHALVHD